MKDKTKNREVMNLTKLNKYNLLAVSFYVGLAFVCSSAQASTLVADEVISHTNIAREQSGLPTLTESQSLNNVAQRKLDDMLARDYFDHTSPDGVKPWKWFELEKYEYKFAGENLAMDFTDAKEQQGAWMKSSTHRDNILNSRFEDVGVAVGQGIIRGQETTVTVQIFGTPKYRILALAEENTPKSLVPSASFHSRIPYVLGADDVGFGMIPTVNEVSASVYEARSAIAWTIVALMTALTMMFEYVAITRIIQKHQKRALKT